MTQDKPNHLKKYSDDEIKELIHRAENFKKISPSSGKEIADFNILHEKKPIKLAKYSIPLALLAIGISAFYLSGKQKNEEIPIVKNTPKEMTVLSKKLQLVKDSNLRFLKIEDTLGELADLRKNHLNEAKEKIIAVLDENENAPSSDFNDKLNQAISNYLKIEFKEKELLSSSLDDLYKEAACIKKEDFELFSVLIDKENFTPYLHEKIATSLKISSLLSNFKISRLHNFWDKPNETKTP